MRRSRGEWVATLNGDGQNDTAEFPAMLDALGQVGATEPAVRLVMGNRVTRRDTWRRKGIRNVSYVSSGEGTTSQGEFHEAVNWASREKLAVLFVIQNNRYAISVPVEHQTAGKDGSVAEMMGGFHTLYRKLINGTDFSESYEELKKAIEYIKSGKGPALIEANVVRLQSHSSSDDQRKYRDHSELEKDKQNDPIEKFVAKLEKESVLNDDDYKKIWKEINEEIDEAADKAFKSSDPDPKDASRYVYDESGLKDSLDYEKNTPAGEKIVMVDAINHSLHEEMKRNKDMYIFGEDIADMKGGVFTATKGLSTNFGDDPPPLVSLVVRHTGADQ